MTKSTNQQLADRLEVSVTAVAVMREVLMGSSAHSQRALQETEDDHLVAAATWLVKFKGCYSALDGVTKATLRRVRELDGFAGEDRTT